MKRMKNNYMTSLRLPLEWHEWVCDFADHWHTSPSYIYKSAIVEFMRKQKSASQ